MATILFVHGTGSRELDYSAALRKLQGNLPEHRVLECLWGDAVGARLHLRGASIPEYDGSRPGKPADPAVIENARWGMLYQDPLFELRLLEQRRGERLRIPPSSLQPGEQAIQRARDLQVPPEFLETVRATGLEDSWKPALSAVVDAADFEKLLLGANLPWLDTTRPIARALVASLIRNGEAKGVAPPVGEMRDALVELLIPALGGQPMGVFSWGLEVFASMATALVRWKKRGVFDEHSSKIADIVHYQARGGKIREFIRERIVAAGPEVIVLCHSLGGVACVDLLAKSVIPNVKALITAGSQAGFFYEVDALTSLPFGEGLPDRFPRWVNYYDPADFLSYQAALSFPGRVTDVAVDNGQPFPQSHSAYWDNRTVLAGIRAVAAE